ncbi:cobyric acid synthase [Pontivivens insulae]|uniref:Cobyric acid synthase n=1 Tax=Pontivivens insulae TaxID=1639689 RepID=A0A2R8AFV5_9RHOB|nr:cobyric acid synthase [Pontivivens insulae]RED12309.1 adenosylcobyric acid synthase (glutamine-hydrolysing) [Pontivivens insulae]SPF31066.1 Cobyric acid synthase [Pontivivens insulae]
MGKAIMVQGTGSNVGKSVLVAGLCRAALNRGLTVRPFKPQNMSNNAAVTPKGGEIGRAQALQAIACKVEAHVDMNPVLLKPMSETGSQVVVQGQVRTVSKGRDYANLKGTLADAVHESFNRLKAGCDLVVVEGAGSPAETNLRTNDIANMGFARAADIPVLLVGDIDRGGVIAQMAGHKAVMEQGDVDQVVACAINKFRGDISLFAEGERDIERFTGWPVLGTIPWFVDATRLPAEDALEIRSAGAGDYKIAVPRLARIANFDDLDPLKLEPGVTIDMVEPGRALPGDADLVILPGSKSTAGDLAFLRAQGWDIDLEAHLRRGGHVLGICGGYQMLGQTISDPQGVDGTPGEVAGLGHLDIHTVMAPKKTLGLSEGQAADGSPIRGYEIHMGESTGPDCARPFAHLPTGPEGAVNVSGTVAGTYLHGLFSSDAFRRSFLQQRGVATANLDYDVEIDRILDDLARHLEAHLDLDRLFALAR